MASESQATIEIQSSTQTFSIFIPLLFNLTSSDPDLPGSDPDQNSGNRDRVIIINPSTQGMVVIEGTGLNLETLFRTPPEKEGTPPAAKSAIEAMPSVDIGEDDEGECPICLEGYRVGDNGGTVKEMPCKHVFHGGCIERWLGIHGSCPVCRFTMPAEEEGVEKKGEDREGEGGERRRIWLNFSFPGVMRSGEVRENGGDVVLAGDSVPDSGEESGSDPGNGAGQREGQEERECGVVDSGDPSDSMEDID